MLFKVCYPSNMLQSDLILKLLSSEVPVMFYQMM